MVENMENIEGRLQKSKRKLKYFSDKIDDLVPVNPERLAPSSQEVIDATFTNTNKPYVQEHNDNSGWFIGNKGSMPNLYRKKGNKGWIMPY